MLHPMEYQAIRMGNGMEDDTSPRIGVIICNCGQEIAGLLDTEDLRQLTADIRGVVYTNCEAYPCSKDGQARIRQSIEDHGLERVLIAGCAPRLVEKLFRETVESAGIRGNYLEVVDIREGCVYVHPNDTVAAFQQAAGIIEMGVARLGTITLPHEYCAEIVRKALVIGSGLSGLTTAIALADEGIRVTLVEQDSRLGGKTFPLQSGAAELITQQVKKIKTHPNVHIMLNSHVTSVSGQPGNYTVSACQGNNTSALNVGAVIVASGAEPQKLNGYDWYDRSRVRTHLEFDAELDDASKTERGLVQSDVVMVLDGGEINGGRGSPLNSNSTIRQAIRVKQLSPDANVTLLFRDLYLGVQGGPGEDDFMYAQELGIPFFRYYQGRPPVIHDSTIEMHDHQTGEITRIPFDRVVFSLPIMPREGTDSLAGLLHLPQDEQGFLIEPRFPLRPDGASADGVYVSGSVHLPVDTAETLFQAYLTSVRTKHFLAQETICKNPPVAGIDPGLCTGCGSCAQVCPTQAIQMIKRDGLLSLSEVDELRCIGCGNCLVVCPVKAIALPGWSDQTILAQISAALATTRYQNSFNGVSENKPRIVALTCEWSAYSAAEIAGARRESNFPDVKIIRMNCSARLDPDHILWAFLNGADGVFVGICNPGECHYRTGNLYARERVKRLKNQLADHGVDPRRLHLEFMSGDDYKKFIGTVTRFANQLTVEQTSLKSEELVHPGGWNGKTIRNRSMGA